MPEYGIASRAPFRGWKAAKRTRAVTALAVALSTFSGPSAASDFTPPQGCEAFLTVQSRGCSVSVMWRCDLAPDGDFSEASYGPDGLETLVSYTASYQWIDTVYTWDQSREEFLPPAADPIDVAGLIKTGIDTYEFSMRRSEPDRTYEIRVTGADELTGATSEIDGYTLDHVHTRLEIADDEGNVEYSSDGIQYFSRALGQFFLGTETVQFEDGERGEFDTTPVDIIEPGEPGFGSTVPLYDCTATDAALRAPHLAAPEYLSAKETDDDEV